MSISARSAGTWAIATADPVTFVIPAGATTGDLMLLQVSWKDYSVTADVSGWTELLEWANGTDGAGNGSGSMKVGLWYKEHTGSESDPSWNPSGTANIGAGVITVFQKGAGEQWVAPAYATATLSWGTGGGTATAGNTLDISDGDIVVALVGIRDDSSGIGRGTATGIGGAGVTWNGNYTEYPATHYSTTTNLDMSADAGYRAVTTGSAGVSLTAQGTLDATETGSVMFVRLRSIKPTGTGALTLAAATLAGVGTASEFDSATGALSLPPSVIVGSGAYSLSAVGALTLPSATVAAVGDQTNAAAGVLDLPAVTVISTGSLSYAATSELTLGPTTVDGTGSHTIPSEPVTSTARIQLGTVADPGVHYGHAIVLRARVQSGSGHLHIELYDGAEKRAEVEQELSTTLTDYVLAISEAEAGDIADYSALEFRFWGESDSVGVTFEIDTLALEVPDFGGAAAVGALTLAAAAVSGVGEHLQTAEATGAIVLPASEVAGVSTQAFEATGALTGQPVTVVGAATETNAATGSLGLGTATIAGVGAESFSATGAVTGQPLVIAGVGSESVAATGALTLGTATIDGAGSNALGLFATGDLVTTAATVSGAAAQTSSATGGVVLPPATLAGAAKQSLAATGAAALPAATVAATGEQLHESSGDVVLVAPTMDGTGLVSFTAAGDIALPGLAIDGAGTVLQAITGTGALSVGGLVIDGVADNGEVVTPTPGGYYRRRPLPKPKPMPIVGTGGLVVAAATVRGTARSELDDLWLYLEPALYLAGVT